MKIVIHYVLKLFLFLLLLFITERIIFLLFQFNSLKGISTKEILMVFTHAFAMDVATSCYIVLFAFLLLSIHLFLKGSLIPKTLRYYTNVIILLTGFINVCDIALYQAWGTRINHKAISYLAYPKEAAASGMSTQYILVIVIFILQSIFFIRLSKRYFRNDLPVTSNIIWKISFIVLMPFILVIGMRGGFQTFPIDKSWAYFSRHALLNQAAVNSSWSFIHAVADPVEMKGNPYNFFPVSEARQMVDMIHKTSADSAIPVVITDRPNIVLIMLESFSTDVLEPYGGDPKIAPQFTELSKEGLLFTNFYTPGFRTEQGIAALVSGFPSQPTTTVIRQFGKFDQMPGLPRTLDSAGYTSSYYYGGNLHFASTGSYLRAMGFDKITGEDDFTFKRQTYWGGYDEELFNYFNQDMKDTKQPFFSIIMTSTNHEPFDADVEKIVPGKAGEWCSNYINTVHYTDKCLGELIVGMKKQSWYGNTLIAIVADHAHSCPSKFEINSAPRHHIPFLLVGGALRDEYKGKTNDRLASQVDFPATILSLLKLNNNQYHWSKNIFNPASPAFVFYSFDDGFGWINDRQQLVYDSKLKQVIFVKNNSLSAEENNMHLKNGKAYLEMLIEEYLRFNER